MKNRIEEVNCVNCVHSNPFGNQNCACTTEWKPCKKNQGIFARLFRKAKKHVINRQTDDISQYSDEEENAEYEDCPAQTECGKNFQFEPLIVIDQKPKYQCQRKTPFFCSHPEFYSLLDGTAGSQEHPKPNKKTGSKKIPTNTTCFTQTRAIFPVSLIPKPVYKGSPAPPLVSGQPNINQTIRYPEDITVRGAGSVVSHLEGGSNQSSYNKSLDTTSRYTGGQINFNPPMEINTAVNDTTTAKFQENIAIDIYPAHSRSHVPQKNHIPVNNIKPQNRYNMQNDPSNYNSPVPQQKYELFPTKKYKFPQHRLSPHTFTTPQIDNIDENMILDMIAPQCKPPSTYPRVKNKIPSTYVHDSYSQSKEEDDFFDGYNRGTQAYTIGMAVEATTEPLITYKDVCAQSPRARSALYPTQTQTDVPYYQAMVQAKLPPPRYNNYLITQPYESNYGYPQPQYFPERQFEHYPKFKSAPPYRSHYFGPRTELFRTPDFYGVPQTNQNIFNPPFYKQSIRQEFIYTEQPKPQNLFDNQQPHPYLFEPPQPKPISRPLFDKTPKISFGPTFFTPPLEQLNDTVYIETPTAEQSIGVRIPQTETSTDVPLFEVDKTIYPTKYKQEMIFKDKVAKVPLIEPPTLEQANLPKKRKGGIAKIPLFATNEHTKKILIPETPDKNIIGAQTSLTMHDFMTKTQFVPPQETTLTRRSRIPKIQGVPQMVQPFNFKSVIPHQTFGPQTPNMPYSNIPLPAPNNPPKTILSPEPVLRPLSTFTNRKSNLPQPVVGFKTDMVPNEFTLFPPKLSNHKINREQPRIEITNIKDTSNNNKEELTDDKSKSKIPKFLIVNNKSNLYGGDDKFNPNQDCYCPPKDAGHRGQPPARLYGVSPLQQRSQAHEPLFTPEQRPPRPYTANPKSRGSRSSSPPMYYQPQRSSFIDEPTYCACAEPLPPTLWRGPGREKSREMSLEQPRERSRERQRQASAERLFHVPKPKEVPRPKSREGHIQRTKQGSREEPRRRTLGGITHVN